MSPRQTTLLELFGDFASLWPVEVLQETVGIALDDSEDITTWLAGLNSAIRLTKIRLGALDGRAAVDADIAIDNILSGYPGGFPFVLRAMPDVEFRLLSSGASTAKLFAGVNNAGAPEVVIEGAPVEIRLPAGLVAPHPGPPEHPSGIDTETIGSFTPGNADDLEIVYNNTTPTIIRVHMRIHMTADAELSLHPAVPISFGRCLFSGIPCKAVHDFSLIASPTLIPQTVDWIRFNDLAKTDSGAPNIGTESGAFGVRSLHLDAASEPIKGAADWLKVHADEELPAEVVLDDLVIPFLGLPRHLTAGIRRGIIDPRDPKQTYFFDKAPVQIFFCRDPALGLTLESFFIQVPEVQDEVEQGDPTVNGITLAASLFYAGDSTKSAPPEEGEGDADETGVVSPRALELSLGEKLTPRLTYRREFDGATGLPAAGEGAGKLINALLNHKVAGTTIDVMAFRIGLSIAKLLDDATFLDSAEATVDLFVTSPPTGDDDAFFKMRALDGEKIAFAVEGVGWRQGSFGVGGSILPALPNGVALFFGPVKVVIQEIGLLSEQGAVYLSLTVGVDTPLSKQLKCPITLKRARFRVAGQTDAPRFLLDGIFARLSAGSLLIEAGGFYTERLTGEVRVREFGMSGKVQFKIGATDYGLALDLLIGSVRTPEQSFRYFMAQAIYRSVIIGGFELRNARLLYANNLQPKLEPTDVSAGELRYYNWHRQTNPLSVPGDRRLNGWKSEASAWTIGVGAGASLPALGKICEFNAFILGVDGDDEQGTLFTGELTALSNPKPLGFFALEWDGKTDRFSLLIGVDVKIAEFLKDPPDWSRNIGELTGSLFVSNNPATFALGRIADQRTWLTLQFDADFFVKSFIRFAFGFEMTKGGSPGFGIVVSLEGGIDGGSKFQLSYLARFAISAATFSTGSSDGAVTIAIELAARAELFRVLRVGVSLLAELRYIGARPARTEALLRFRFETPWYLPDITWSLDCTFGETDTAGLSTAVCPLRLAAAIEGPQRENTALHLARFDPNDPAFDPSWDGSGAAPTFSLRQFATTPTPEAIRIDRFEADQSVHPIATDATVVIDWNVAVNDQLSLGAAVARGRGTQSSGELDLDYDLVSIKVRRRSRFGPDRLWRDLDTIVELGPDFSDPNGVNLDGEYGPQTLAKVWDHDLRIDGETAPKRLLINGSTPFSFSFGDPETDEQTVSDNPNWPCCRPQDTDGPIYSPHILQFRSEPVGRRIVGERVFTDSESRLQFLRPAIVRPSLANQLTPPNAVVASLRTVTPGPFLRVEFDEAAAYCNFRLAWSRSIGILELIGFDADGAVVGRLQQLLNSVPGYQEITLNAQGPMHRMEARLLLPEELAGAVSGVSAAISLPTRPGIVLEIDRVSYVGLREFLDDLRLDLACQNAGNETGSSYTGRGKLFFLPNHDYEIAVTTRLSITHPSAPSFETGVTEHIYFKTKGLPGLNAVARPGEEVEPYVAAAYSGGRGLLYREEPAALAFTESFLVAVPLANRPAESSDEHTVLQELQLLVQPEIATTPQTLITATATDWIVDHRTTFPGPIRNDWVVVLSNAVHVATPIRSQDPFQQRLARLTQRSHSNCDLPDPVDVTGSVLLAPPQGLPHPNVQGQEIWPESSQMTATARAKGAAFVDRRPFVLADWTAFSFTGMNSPDNGSNWAVEDGRLLLADAAARRFALFGDSDWNHLTVQIEAYFDQSVGIAIALPQTASDQGLFVAMERIGETVELVIYSRVGGGGFIELERDVVEDAPTQDVGLALTVDAFDDRLRATALDTSIEVARNGFREGRLALFGEGSASFASLQVHGLDVYRFTFATSRYVSFPEHIASFVGSTPIARPNDLGVGTTTATVGGLWIDTRSEITAAMTFDGSTTSRQNLFDRWLTSLGIPLRQDVLKLEITRFVEAARTELLLIESPEPIDFSVESSVTLARLQPAPPSPLLGDRRPVVRSDPTRLPPTQTPRPIILSATAITDGYRLELDALAFAQTGTFQNDIVAVDRSTRGLTFFRGRPQLQPRPLKRIFVEVREVSVIPIPDTIPPLPLFQELRKLKVSQIALLAPDLTHIVDVFTPPKVEPPVEITVIGDGSGKRAVLIPHRGSAHSALDGGSYSLTFRIDRTRWATTSDADEDNRYRAEAALRLDL